MDQNRKWTWNENNIAWLVPINFECTNSLPFLGTENFIKAIHDNGQIVEGATQEEIHAFVSAKIELVNDLYTKLYKSALERVTNKKGSLEYLNIQREEYEEKYRVSLQILNDEVVNNQFIYDQMNDEKDFEDFAGNNLNLALAQLGLTTLNDRLKDFCQIVKFKFEYADALFNEFKSMIIYFRTRLITDLELLDFDKFNQRIILANSITNETTIQEIQNLYIQFKNV